jgi:hypothetical protein
LCVAQKPALAYFVRRDLLDQAASSVELLWEAVGAARLVRTQQADGSWRYAGKILLTMKGLLGEMMLDDLSRTTPDRSGSCSAASICPWCR